jgi:hypothetical protein
MLPVYAAETGDGEVLRFNPDTWEKRAFAVLTTSMRKGRAVS